MVDTSLIIETAMKPFPFPCQRWRVLSRWEDEEEGKLGWRNGRVDLPRASSASSAVAYNFESYICVVVKKAKK